MVWLGGTSLYRETPPKIRRTMHSACAVHHDDVSAARLAVTVTRAVAFCSAAFSAVFAQGLFVSVSVPVHVRVTMDVCAAADLH